MPERRRSERWFARLRVRFWHPSSPEKVHQGFTTDISPLGTFIQTEHPLGADRRVRIEFLTEDTGFMTEAVVVRAKRIPLELRQAQKGGMGVRFLTMAEVLEKVGGSGRAALARAVGPVEPLRETTEPGSGRGRRADGVTGGAGRAEAAGAVTAPSARPAGAPTPAASPPPPVAGSTPRSGDGDAGAPPRKRTEFEARSDASRAVASRHPAAPRARPEPLPEPEVAAEPEERTEPAESTEDTEPAVQATPSSTDDGGHPAADAGGRRRRLRGFRIAPPDAELLETLFHAELEQDRLFLPTDQECPEGETVRLELVLPGAVGTLELRARVVQAWSPPPDDPTMVRGLGLHLEPWDEGKRTIRDLLDSHRSTEP